MHADTQPQVLVAGILHELESSPQKLGFNGVILPTRNGVDTWMVGIFIHQLRTVEFSMALALDLVSPDGEEIIGLLFGNKFKHLTAMARQNLSGGPGTYGNAFFIQAGMSTYMDHQLIRITNLARNRMGVADHASSQLVIPIPMYVAALVQHA